MIQALKRHDFTILLCAYFFLLPMGKTLWYPLLVMAIIGGFILARELRSEEGLTGGTKWLLFGGACIYIPALASMLNTVDAGRTGVFLGSYPLFFLAGYFIYKRLANGIKIMPAVWIITAIVGIWGILAVWQYLDPTNNPFGPGVTHNQGIHNRDNQFVDGGLMMGVILGSLFAFLSIAIWSKGKHLAALVIGICIAGLIFISGTRSAWASVMVSIAAVPVYAWISGLRPNLKHFLVAGLAFIMIGFGGYKLYQQPGLSTKLNQTLIFFQNPNWDSLDRTLSGRLTIWTDAVNLGKSSPLVGYGVNNFRFSQPLVAPENSRWVNDFSDRSDIHKEKGASHTHQMFLEAWSGAGSLGVLGLLIYFLFLAKTSINVSKAGNLVAAGALIALWAGFFPLNTHNNFYGGWMNAWFWVWMGISAGLIFRKTNEVEGS
jgi:O-antigen ligase